MLVVPVFIPSPSPPLGFLLCLRLALLTTGSVTRGQRPAPLPNGDVLTITLNAQSSNRTHTGDQIMVWDHTDEACIPGQQRVGVES
jgi:hypothetical protein